MKRSSRPPHFGLVSMLGMLLLLASCGDDKSSKPESRPCLVLAELIENIELFLNIVFQLLDVVNLSDLFLELLQLIVRTGDIVQVTVILESKQGVLWLPPAAIRTFEGRNFVVVRTEGQTRRVDIKVGIKNEEKVEIVEGLEEGEVVIGP